MDGAVSGLYKVLEVPYITGKIHVQSYFLYQFQHRHVIISPE